MHSDDLLQTFRLERTHFRGRVVRLGSTVDTVLSRHDYPEPVSRILGELLALAASLAGALKFDGVFSLQTRSDGPVSLMVADCTNEGGLRGYAKIDTKRLPQTGAPSVRELLGDGVLALTVDQSPSGGETYQGMVELTGDSLDACMQAYFRQSEQVPTGLRVAVSRNGANRSWRAGAIVVQRMPEDPGADGDTLEDWRRTMILLSTAGTDELTDSRLSPDDLLFRLFHEEGVRVYQPQPLSFACRCSRDRVVTLLRRFGPEEVASMRDDDGTVRVTCQFCSQQYDFDPIAMNAVHETGEGRTLT